MTIKRTLNAVGKRTFVNCFEARQIKRYDLNKNEVMEEDYPYCEEWTEGTLTTKTYTLNRIFRERNECQALQICCKAEKLDYKIREKAERLCKQYCKGCC